MRRELNLGGLSLTASHGDVDIRTRDGLDRLRIERADLDEIIAFLQQARKDKV